MRKKQIYYVIFWIALIGLFNILCFVTPDEVNGVKTFSGAFWPGYIFVTIALVCHLVFSMICLSETNRERKIVNMSLSIISYIELLVMVVFGIGCMLDPVIPNWLGIILCYAVLAVSVLFLLSAKVVGENSSNANSILNSKVFRMRELTDQARDLISAANDVSVKQELQKVYEAIRYSDPTSSEDTRVDENEMLKILDEIKALIESQKNDAIRSKADELISIIERRNDKCKTLKRQRIKIGGGNSGDFEM